MRLTHIKLAGFKSFTDPTTIHTPSQLVAVIGPNGCGKSNVIDAVRWVLGEASAKQLRGESMQDVIFNGAATRRPAPRASVELVFDNSDHSLQGSWGQYAEISIKRQLTRQGESTYFINNQVVRRKDITDLFLGTGVGARGYAVIEQGMISRIIEARPEELRAYLEEAAGVSKYKERRRETEARLKDTREHLQRLADLQSELTRQMEKLEKQAQTAERYQQFQQKLEHTQNLLLFLQWKQSLIEADTASEQHYSAQYQQEQAQENAQILGEQIQNVRETELEQQQEVHSLNQQHALLREQMARLEEQIRAQSNQLQRMERDRANAQNQLQKIEHDTLLIQSECQLIQEDVLVKQEELSELSILAMEHEAKLPELEIAQQEMQIAYQSQQDEFNRIKRELALKQQQIKHLEDNLATQNTRKGRLIQEQNTLNLPPEQELLHIQAETEILQNQYDESEIALQNGEQTALDCKNQVQELEKQFNQINALFIAKQAQQQAIAQILQESEADANSFWAQTRFADAPQLWQHLTAPTDWQHALSVVLAERVQARLLPENFDFTKEFDLNALPKGSASWIQSAQPLSKKTQPAQALINQIQVEKSFQAVLQFWLDGVLCAPNLSYALSQQNELQNHQLWLTPEGHRVDKFSVILHDPNDSQQRVQQQILHDQLSQELKELEPQLSDFKKQLNQKRQAREEAEQALKHWHQQNRQCATALQTAQSRANELFARTNQAQLRNQNIIQELQQLEEEIHHTTHTQTALQQDMDNLILASQELESQHESLSGSHQHQQNAYKQAQLAVLEVNRQKGIAEIALHKQQQKLDHLHQQLANLAEQKLDWQGRQSELALDEINEEPINQQKNQLDTLKEHAQSVLENIEQAQTRLNETQEKGRALYQQQQTLAAQLPHLQSATQNALLKQQEALLNAKRYHEQLLENHAHLDQLEQDAKNAESTHVLQQQVAQFSNQIQSLGAVNLAALQELEETRERDIYYKNQSDDVQSAIALLEEAIAQIDDETKSRFKETFDLANEKVQTFFPTLFGGGEAHLKMTDDDLLTAGVSIMARPPGKKNSTIHLLSGGEKALTAVSLVFALFSLNPAPFCLLDEVDAPLDDANTNRLCHLIKEMSAQTQFLYISHNRITMEMAEQLVGVTMQEKGVSRVVAVDIQQAIKMAEN